MVSLAQPFRRFDADGVLYRYSGWLAHGHSSARAYQAMRGDGVAKADDACLNHLFVHNDRLGGVLGVAFVGVICDTNPARTQYGINAMNSGYTTSSNGGYELEHLTELIVTTHELGHNFGAQHDCALEVNEDVQTGQQITCPTTKYPFNSNSARAQCIPNGAATTSDQGGYIMYPSAPNIGTDYNRLWSSCSRQNIADTVRSGGSCLLRPDDKAADSGSNANTNTGGGGSPSPPSPPNPTPPSPPTPQSVPPVNYGSANSCST